VSRSLAMFAPVVILLACGCGGDDGGGTKAPTVALTGKLLVDGTPRGNASIRFTPVDAEGGVRTAYAQTDSDGNFEATTYVTGDGIVPGKYTVSLGSDEDGGFHGPCQDDGGGRRPVCQNE
jgi:hypothetical protein